MHCLHLVPCQEPETRHDAIPLAPLSDCVKLSMEQYRAKLYDIIIIRAAQRGKLDMAAGKRRASSHELCQQEAVRDTRTGDTHQVSMNCRILDTYLHVSLFGKYFESV